MKHHFRVYGVEPQKKNTLWAWILSWIRSLNLTGGLILVNILIFILIFLLEIIFGQPIITSRLALQANNFFNNGYIWTLLTSMFMHASFFHLFVNMFSLFFLGKFLEMILGKKRFFWFYLLAGIFAGLFFVVLSYFFGGSLIGAKIFGAPGVYAVGASGAIFALAGVLALLTPRNRVYLIAGPLIALIAGAVIMAFIQNQALLNTLDFIIMIYIFISIFSMFSANPRTRAISIPIAMPFWFLPIAAIVPLVLIGFFVELPIGNMAHLGGFIAGALYGVYLRLRYKRKTRIISEYFSR